MSLRIALLLLLSLATPGVALAEIGGWTLGSTTLTGGDIVLSAAGDITAGTSNNVVRISDTGTNRLWVGHATSGSAPFRVTNGGAVTMTNATLGNGSITISSTGISFTSGSGDEDKIKWSDGSVIYSDSDDLFFGAANTFFWSVDAGTLQWNGNALYTGSANKDLGTSSNRWRDLLMTGTIKSSGLTGTGNDYVCVNSSGEFFRSDSAC